MRVRTAHISLQFSDSNEKHKEDITKIFERAAEQRVAWITGTESGPGAGNTGRVLVETAHKHGYRPWVPEHQADGIAENTDCWVAVRKDLIEGDWDRGFDLSFRSSRHFDDRENPDNKSWGPKGLVNVSFDSTNRDLGRVSIGAAHYLTGGRKQNSAYWNLNEKISETIGDWARKEGKGSALVFYGGDQNMQDNKNREPQGDTFFGEPLTSTWDEIEKWPNTGHGNIDVIASYNRDGRVSAMRSNVLDDSEFRLHTDHFYVEAIFVVAPRRRR